MSTVTNFTFRKNYSEYLQSIEEKERTAAIKTSKALLYTALILGVIGFFITYRSIPFFIQNYLSFIVQALQNAFNPKIAKYAIDIVGGVYSFFLEAAIAAMTIGLYNSYKKGRSKGVLYFALGLLLVMGVTIWSNSYTVDQEIAKDIRKKEKDLGKDLQVSTLLGATKTSGSVVESLQKQIDMLQKEAESFRPGSAARNRRLFQIRKLREEMLAAQKEQTSLTLKATKTIKSKKEGIKKSAKIKYSLGLIIAAAVEITRAILIFFSLLALSIAPKEDLEYCLDGSCEKGKPKAAGFAPPVQKPAVTGVAAETKNRPIGFVSMPEKMSLSDTAETKLPIGRSEIYSFFNQNDLKKGVVLVYKNGEIKPGDNIPSNAEIAKDFGFSESGKKVQSHHISQLVKAELKKIGAIRDIPGKPQKAVLGMEEALKKLKLD